MAHSLLSFTADFFPVYFISPYTNLSLLLSLVTSSRNLIAASACLALYQEEEAFPAFNLAKIQRLQLLLLWPPFIVCALHSCSNCANFHCTFFQVLVLEFPNTTGCTLIYLPTIALLVSGITIVLFQSHQSKCNTAVSKSIIDKELLLK